MRAFCTSDASQELVLALSRSVLNMLGAFPVHFPLPFTCIAGEAYVSYMHLLLGQMAWEEAMRVCK